MGCKNFAEVKKSKVYRDFGESSGRKGIQILGRPKKRGTFKGLDGGKGR